MQSEAEAESRGLLQCVSLYVERRNVELDRTRHGSHPFALLEEYSVELVLHTAGSWPWIFCLQYHFSQRPDPVLGSVQGEVVRQL